jgi:hypothetical protein
MSGPISTGRRVGRAKPVAVHCAMVERPTYLGQSMDDDQRLAAIAAATTYEELRAAMAGYHERAVELYPNENFEHLRRCLEAGTYFHVVEDLNETEAHTGRTFLAIRPILEAAARVHVERFNGEVPLDLPGRAEPNQ